MNFSYLEILADVCIDKCLQAQAKRKVEKFNIIDRVEFDGKEWDYAPFRKVKSVKRQGAE